MKLRVQLLEDTATMPRKAHASDACFDLYCSREGTLAAGATGVFETGLAIELEEGWEAQIRGRSGLASKGIVAHHGTIDHLYRKPLKIIIHNMSGSEFHAKVGDRIAQMKISKIWQVELVEAEVQATERGGLGSTGLR